MKFTKKFLIIATVIATVVACAKREESSNLFDLEDESLAGWIERYNDTASVKYTPTGLGSYMYKVKEGDGEAINEEDWVFLDYVGYTIDGNIFANRYESISKILGLYNPRIYYTPRLYNVVSGYDFQSIPGGVYNELIEMKVGDEIDLVLPSYMAYGTLGYSATNGYEGNKPVLASQPCRIRFVATKNAGNDIDSYQSDLVWQFAQEYMNISEQKDSLATDFYYKILKEGEDPDSVIDASSLYYFYYEARIADGNGFLLDTNIDSVALKEWGEIINGKPLDYVGEEGDLITAFSKVAGSEKLTYGCEYEMVFSSDYGYGDAGQQGTSTTTTIQPYTPLYYKVYVVPAEEEEEEDEE